MLLTDVRILDTLQVVNESAGPGKPMKVRGVFQRADEANNNGRIYPQQVLENAINNLIEAVQERRCVGELDHPTYDMVKLSNASHIITSLRFEGKDVIGEAEILSTPAGKVVEALIRDGIKIGISSRGMGTLSEGKGHKIVNEDFKLLTFDIVADPSTRGAFPSLTESVQSKAVENTIKKVVGRNVFLSLLESKIDSKLDELRVDEKRCWKGYEPTPGVEPYAKGSCRLKRKKRKDEAIVLETKEDKKFPEGKPWSDKDKEKYGVKGNMPGLRGAARIDRFILAAQQAGIEPNIEDRLAGHRERRGKKPQPQNSSNMYEKYAGKFIQEMKSCGYGKAAKKKGGKK
jgi:hypothetical protein